MKTTIDPNINLPEAKRIFQDVEFSFNKRLANGWQLGGSVVYSSLKGNYSFPSRESRLAGLLYRCLQPVRQLVAECQRQPGGHLETRRRGDDRGNLQPGQHDRDRPDRDGDLQAVLVVQFLSGSVLGTEKR